MPLVTGKDIENRFNYHAPNDTKRKLHEEARAAITDLAKLFNQIIPVSREAALVQTKLEEAMFWANAAIARSNKGKD